MVVRPPERKADTMKRNALVTTLVVLVGLPLIVLFSDCARPDRPQASTTAASYLFVWAGDADEEDSDFLAVIDARRSEPTYGQVIATLPGSGLVPRCLITPSTSIPPTTSCSPTAGWPDVRS